MKKKLVTIVLALTCVLACAFGFAACDSQQKGLQYKKVDGGYSVSYYNGARTGADGYITVTIPSEYKGEPVIGIEKEAFKGCAGISEIKLPDTIVSIGDNAFERTSLTGMRLPTSVTTIGKSLFLQCPGSKGVDGRWYFPVDFEGTQEQWDAVTKKDGWNTNSASVKVTCLG